jgi:hypothetical protein
MGYYYEYGDALQCIIRDLLLVLWSPLIESSDICSWCDDANQLLLLISIFIHPFSFIFIQPLRAASSSGLQFQVCSSIFLPFPNCMSCCRWGGFMTIMNHLYCNDVEKNNLR